jgi:hypothetical protein
MEIKDKREDNDHDQTESFPLVNYSNELKDNSTIESEHIQLISELNGNKECFKPENNISQ